MPTLVPLVMVRFVLFFLFIKSYFLSFFLPVGGASACLAYFMDRSFCDSAFDAPLIAKVYSSKRWVYGFLVIYTSSVYMQNI